MAFADPHRARTGHAGAEHVDKLDQLKQNEYLWWLEDCAAAQSQTVSLISIHVAVYAGIFGLILTQWPAHGPFPVMQAVFGLGAPVIPFWLTGYILAFDVINVVNGYQSRLIERMIYRESSVVVDVDTGGENAPGRPGGSATVRYPFAMHMNAALLSGTRGLPEFKLLMAIGGALNLLPLIALLAISGYQVANVEEPARAALVRVAWPVFAVYLLFLVLALRVKWMSTYGGYNTWNRLLAKLGREFRRTLADPPAADDDPTTSAPPPTPPVVPPGGTPTTSHRVLARRSHVSLHQFRPGSVVSYLLAPRPASALARGLWIVTAPSALVALAASGAWDRWPAVLAGVLGFELLYHGRYVVNDLHGRTEDRTNPTKAGGGPLNQMTVRPAVAVAAVAGRAAVWTAVMAVAGQLATAALAVAAVAGVTFAYEATRDWRADGLPRRVRFGAYLTAFTGGYVVRCLFGFWIGAGFAWWPVAGGFPWLLGLYMTATASGLALLFVRLAVTPYLGATTSLPTRTYLTALHSKGHLLHAAHRGGLVDSCAEPVDNIDRPLHDAAINVLPLPLRSARVVLLLLGLAGGAGVGAWLSDGALPAGPTAVCVAAALGCGLVMALRAAPGLFWTAMTLTVLYAGVCGAAGLDRPWLAAIPLLLNVFSHAMYRTFSFVEVM